MRVEMGAINIIACNLPHGMEESEKVIFDKLLAIVNEQRVENDEIRLHVSETLKEHEVHSTNLVVANDSSRTPDPGSDDSSTKESRSGEESDASDHSSRSRKPVRIQRNLTTVGYVEISNQSGNSSIKSSNQVINDEHNQNHILDSTIIPPHDEEIIQAPDEVLGNNDKIIQLLQQKNLSPHIL